MLLTRKRVLAAKVEATPGDAETLAAGQAAFNIFDAVIQPNIDFEERIGQAAFSPLRGELGARGGQITFRTEMVDGWPAVFLPACGWVASGSVYSPCSEGPGTNVKTITIGLYEDGVYKKLYGCMGTAVFVFPAGRVAYVEWTFTGIWAAPSDVGLLAPSYPTGRPPRFANSDITIGSWTPRVAEVRIDLGNTVILREDADDALAAGYSTAIVTGRRVVGSLNPESNLVAGDDPHADWLGSVEAALAITLSTMSFAAPKLQFTNVQEGDRNGLQVDEVEFQLNRSADAGDDEFTITIAGAPTTTGA